MFKFILKNFTAKFAKRAQGNTKFFGALCVIFAPFAVKNDGIFA